MLGWTCETIARGSARGVSIRPHKNCAPLRFLFDEDGDMRHPDLPCEGHHPIVFIYTDFAPAEVHAALCGLFHHVQQRFFRQLDIVDNSGFWTHGDLRLLEARLQQHEQQLADEIATMYAETLQHEECERTGYAGYCTDEAMELEEALETTRYWLRCMPEGPQPPADAEECLSWGVERWVAFWEEWDEYRSPCIKFMRNFAPYHASVERAMSLHHHECKECDGDASARERKLKRLLKRAAEEISNEAFLADEARMESAAELEFYHQPWNDDHIIPEHDTIASSDLEYVEQIIVEWQEGISYLDASHVDSPLPEYIRIVLGTVIIGLRSASALRRFKAMDMAVPTRLMVAATRLDHVAMALQTFDDPSADTDASEMEDFADFLREQ